MTERVAGVIPARYGSTRFPGKPLASLWGRPLILHVCDRMAEARRMERFWVATDDRRIAEVVTAAGFEARLTPSTCRSGTDRIAASLSPEEPWTVLVNVQGDEPNIAPGVIDAVAQALLDAPAERGVSTAATWMTDPAMFESPHVVKVVCAPDGRALYFSRAALPSPARLDPAPTVRSRLGLKHLGIYGYRRPVLEAFAHWSPTPLEQRECLEQLRFLEHGIDIQVALVVHDSIGVDTPEELKKLEINTPPRSNG